MKNTAFSPITETCGAKTNGQLALQRTAPQAASEYPDVCYEEDKKYFYEKGR